MIDRLKLAQRVDEIVVCTSANPQDDPLVELAVREGIGFFRGDEEDVIKRLAEAATAFDADFVLNITADCPFSDPMYADRIVEALETTGADLVRALDLPHGAYSYGIKASALRQVVEIKDDEATEVWGRYFTDTDIFSLYDLPVEPRHRQPLLRMTLDYPEDFEFFKAVFDHLYQPDRVFRLDEILELLDRHPEIVDLNRHCATAYRKRWTRQSAIKLKPRHAINRAAVIGCGSIGRRHIRNMQKLGVPEIVALRTRLDEASARECVDGVREVDEWPALIETRPDVAIISNPSSLHLEAVNRLLPFVRGIFVEKPLASSLAGVPELLHEIRKRRLVSFVGYNLQFHPGILAAQDFAASEIAGTPLVFQCQVGQWIEDWHPHRDYRKAYFARKDLGGGVSLSLIHEIHLAQKLLGPAKSVYCLLPRTERLDLDVDTIADFTIRHDSGAVSQIHLDLLQRPAQRRGVLSFDRGWVDYDLMANEVRALSNGSEAIETLWSAPGFDSNEPYLEEMSAFLNYVREGRVRHEHDAWHAAQSLATVVAGLTSAESQRAEEVSMWL
jgi:spore coat polysaccharide biosynthesis protein SpsF (cytidylyltransferase family)/predicted dehydrogenase